MDDPACDAFVALADGSVFHGISRGYRGHTQCELVFNTAMSGYQEALTDPSYRKQAICFTFPHIGIVGHNTDDAESNAIQVAGVIALELSPIDCNFRSSSNIIQHLNDNFVIAIDGIDTRALTRRLRTVGAIGCSLVADNELSVDEAIAAAKSFGNLDHHDLASQVTAERAAVWSEPRWQLTHGRETDKSSSMTPAKVAILDMGCKSNIARIVSEYTQKTTIFPANTSAEQLCAEHDIVLISNGPGDPTACTYAVDTVKELLARKVPVLGICLGHQIIGLAAGAEVIRLKFGHHGVNHPVLDIDAGTVAISSQNHNYALAEDSVAEGWKVTHRSLFDQSVQGIANADETAFGFQGHPEASPGPIDLQLWIANKINKLYDSTL